MFLTGQILNSAAPSCNVLQWTVCCIWAFLGQVLLLTDSHRIEGSPERESTKEKSRNSGSHCEIALNSAMRHRVLQASK